MRHADLAYQLHFECDVKVLIQKLYCLDINTMFVMISVTCTIYISVSHSIAYVHFFFSSLFLLVLKSFSYKAICNWKFVHRHPRHLDFCRQCRRIRLGYNSRIRNFWYLFSYIFCFSFWLLFYLDRMFAVENYKLLLYRD